MQDLINHLLSVDLTRRLGCMRAGAKGIRDHPFFSGFDWKGLAERNRLMLMLVLIMHFNQTVRGQMLLPFTCWCKLLNFAVIVKVK